MIGAFEVMVAWEIGGRVGGAERSESWFCFVFGMSWAPESAM